MKLNKLILISIILIFGNITKAQDTLFPNMIPPSPSVAAFMKFTDNPTDLFSGTVSYTIPVFTVNAKSISVPVSIAYHASGIKVSENASWIGLGWALNAGGRISRQKVGTEDERAYSYFKEFTAEDLANQKAVDDDVNAPVGYFASRKVISDGYLNSPPTGGSQKVFHNKAMLSIARGAIDIQPDLFSFSVNGLSGKIIFESDENGIMPHVIPYQDIKVNFKMDEGNDRIIEFTLIDNKGITYIFDDYETTQYEQQMPFTSSWALTKIIAPNKKDSISFIYQTVIEKYKISPGKSRQIELQSNNYVFESRTKTSNGFYTVSTLKIKKIVGPLTTIEFMHAEDIESIENGRQDFVDNTGTKLCEIRYYRTNLPNEYRKFILNYSYFGTGDYSGKRLKLLSAGEDHPELKLYEFTYSDLYSLPAKTSFKQDFWGYYNHTYDMNNNTSFIPTVVLPFDKGLSIGADRKPSADDMPVMANSLLKIKFPSGGYTEFEYEQHDFYYPKAFNSTVVYQEKIDYPPFIGVGDNVGTFNVPRNDSIRGYVIINDPPPGTTLTIWNSEGGKALSYMEPISGQKYNFSITSAGTYAIDVFDSDPGTQNTSVQVFLETMNASLDGSYDFRNKMKGGGLRIKSQKTYDANNLTPSITRRYEYKKSSNTNLSSGKLFIGYPVYGHITRDNKIEYIYTNSTRCDQIYKAGDLTAFLLSSSAESMLNYSSGGYVGYDEVTVYYTDNLGETTKTFTKYHNPDAGVSYSFPFVPDFNRDYKRGKILQLINYQDNNLVTETLYEYTYEVPTNPYRITGFCAFQDETASLMNCIIEDDNYFTDWINIIPVGYDYVESWGYLSQQITKSYLDGGIVIDTINFTSKRPDIVSNTVQLSSSGDLIETETRYPFDAGEQGMLDLNQLNYPLWQTKKVNGLIKDQIKYEYLNAQLANIYKLIDGDFRQKGQVKYKNGLAIEQIIMDEPEGGTFDSDGNLVKSFTGSPQYTTFIWGYKNQYPIVKVQNSTYDEVLALDLAALAENPTNIEIEDLVMQIRLGLPDAIITGYTYDAMFGQTSIIDPNGNIILYEYDDLGRLKLIRDNDKNILKKYVYKMQPEAIQVPENFENGSIIRDKIQPDTYRYIIPLHWDVVDLADKYNLYCAIEAGNYELIYSGTNASFAHNNLIGNTNYSYKLHTFKEGLESEAAILAVKTKKDPPPMPLGLVAVTTGYNQIELSWQDVEGELNYQIKKGLGIDGPYSLPIVVSANTTSYTDNDVEPETTYYYWISSANDESISDYSDDVTSTTWVAPPVAPRVVTASALSSSAIKIDWNNVDNEENYRILRSDSETGNYAVIGTVGKDITTYTDINLNGNTTYYYSVQSYNSHYESALLVIASCTTKKNTPSTPVNFVATTLSNSQIQLTWSDVDFEENYTIAKSTAPGGPFTSITLNANTTTYIDTGLVGDMVYYYYISAYNSDASSPNSGVINATTWPAPPLIPFHFMGSATSSSSIQLSWGNNSNATSFVIHRSDSENGPYSSFPALTSSITSFIDNGLLSNKNYYYKIEAKNEHYSSGLSAPLNIRTLKELPAIPVISSLLVLSNTSIKMTWADVANEENYEITISPSESGPFNLVTLGANTTSYTASGLSANTTYYFRIKAKNSDQQSAYSVFSTAKTFKNPPAVPGGLSATPLSNTSTTLNWTDVLYDEGYYIYRATSSGGTYSLIATTAANIVSYTNSGLAANTYYYYKIRSFNSDYTSGYSAYTSAKTKLNPPGTPTLTLTFPGLLRLGELYIDLSWNDVSGESGYKVYRGTSSGSVTSLIATLSAGVTNYRSDNLSSGIRYYYRVEAYNVDYASSSSIQSMITPPPVPGTISGTAAPCFNSNYNYSVSEVLGASSYNWILPTGWTIIAGQNTRSIAVKAGSSSGSIQVRAQNETGNSGYKSLLVTTTSSVPGAAGTINGLGKVMPGANISFSIAPVANATYYVWTLPPGCTIVSGNNTTAITVKWGTTAGYVKVQPANCVGTCPTVSQKYILLLGLPGF